MSDDNLFQPPDHTLYPRYTGIPTFMRVPYVQDVTQLDIAMVGVPFDSAVTNRPGARHGPREVRNQSSLIRRVHHVTGVNPYDLCKIGDAGDTPVNPVNLMKCLDLITEFYEPIAAAGVTPVGKRGPHIFRHARAVELLRASVPQKIIGDVLGHRSTESTNTYLKLATEDLRAVALDVPGSEVLS